MPHYTLKLGEDQYLEWSTIVDAPITNILSRKEIISFLKTRYPDKEVLINKRLNLVDEVGTSIENYSVEQIIKYNRAGEDEKSISLEEIKQRYKE